MLATLDLKRVKEMVSNVLSSFPEVAGAYHFGSSLGECRPDSDIDIGLVIRPGTVRTNKELELLIERILAKLRPVESHSFDIVILDKDSPLFSFKVIREGRRIYEHDLDAVLDFMEIVSRRYGEVAPRHRRALEEVLGVR